MGINKVYMCPYMCPYMYPYIFMPGATRGGKGGLVVWVRNVHT